MAAVLLAALLLPALLLPSASRAQIPTGPHDDPNGMFEHAEPAAAALAELSTHLELELAQAEGPVSFLAILVEQPDAATLAAVAETAEMSFNQQNNPRGWALYDHLTQTAAHSQAGLRAWLDAEGIVYRPFYIVNMIEIQGDAAIADALRQRPEIARLAANPRIDAGPDLMASTHNELWPAAQPAQSTSADSGIEYTRAPNVWDLGFRGQGIVMASADTGVEWDHPSLQAKYRGWDREAETVDHAYHWLDAWEEEDNDPEAPCSDVSGACDDRGHGTHTTGTMVGAPDPVGTRLIGMAPDAQWIACRNMLNNFGTPASYTACFEFFLAPYPPDSDPAVDGNPDLAPHVINNSWGCPPFEGCDVDSLRQVIEAVRAAGIFVVASAGNDGPACSTVRHPPSLHEAAFSVGAHHYSGDFVGHVTGFSSRGPVTADGSGRLKPNLVAPGSNIYSAYRNHAYVSLQGTSMAAPHVAGAVALLWSAEPSLIHDIEMTEEILLKSATPVPNHACGEDIAPVVPNNTYGYGRLDVFRAVTMALSPWIVSIRVEDADGAPIEGVLIELDDELTGRRYTSETAADGWARWPRIFHGEYTCLIPLASASLETSNTRYSIVSSSGTGSGEGGLTVASCRIMSYVGLSQQLFVPMVQR